MIPQETQEKLLELDRAGFLPAPGESADAFFARVAAVETAENELREELAQKREAVVFDSIRISADDAIPPEIVEEAGDLTDRLYGFRTRHVPGFFLTRGVGLLWGGCMIGDTVEPLAVFLIRGAFRNRRRWLLYRRDELLAHELCHSMRQPLHDQELEEFFAYRTSPSPLRRYLGNCFIHDRDAVLFVLPMLLLAAAQTVQSFWYARLPVWPFWILAPLYLIRLLIRNQRSRCRCFAAARMLERWGIARPFAVLMRCTTPEIRRIAKMKEFREFEELFSGDLRWLIFTARFFRAESE